MADLKISALTGATTPVAGTEVLPIVQSGTTKKVSIANLTVGRDVGMKNAIATGQGVFQGPLDNFWGASGAIYNYYSGGGVIASYSDASGTLSALSFDGSSVALRTGNTARLSIGATDVTVNTGNLIIGTSGKGIDFSATPGTGTSELLSDYEEGTWTAVLRGASTAGTYEFVNNTCQYTKVGRLVTLTAFLRLAGSITGGGSGYAQVTGLPFEKLNNSFACGSVSFIGVVFTGIPLIAPITSGNTSTLYFPQLVTAGGSEVDISGFGTGDYLNFTITYITAS